MDGGVCGKVVFVADVRLPIDLRWGGGAPERSGGVTEGPLHHPAGGPPPHRKSMGRI